MRLRSGGAYSGKLLFSPLDDSLVVVDTSRVPPLLRTFDAATGRFRSALRAGIRTPGAMKFECGDLQVWYDEVKLRWRMSDAVAEESEVFRDHAGRVASTYSVWANG